MLPGLEGGIRRGRSELMTTDPQRQPYLRWSDRFLVGVERLDADHRAIVELINDACSAWAARKQDDLQQSLQRLLDLAAAHFETEEQILRQVPSYTALKTHAGEHRNRLSRLQRILDEVCGAQGEAAEVALPDTLVDWFIKQSIGHDAAIKAYFDEGTPRHGRA